MMNLLLELQAMNHIAYLVISHDLGLVGHLADRIAVMQKAEIVECAASSELFEAPSHPHTRRLLDSVPGRQLDPSLA